MNYKLFDNNIELAKRIIRCHVKTGDKVLDCTVGNGDDTIFLARLIGQQGTIYGFDIQEMAIRNTRKKLQEAGLENRAILIKDSHENIDRYVDEKVNFIIYNLGYLPGGDKSIKTEAETTLSSVKKSLYLLKRNGIMLITCYTGHNGGSKEKKILKDYFKRLDQKEYNVLEFSFLNQINNPPMLFGVEKN